MSAGVSDQRMKSQGNPGSNVCKDQVEGGSAGGEELPESWRHQHQAPSYAAPISSPPDPYTAQGYYGTAGTAFQYQSFGVGDGTWSTNGTDPMTFLGGYAQHDSYTMDGVFGPSTTAFSTATFGQPTSAVAYNYFNSNGDYSTWGGQLGGRNKPYDDYYAQDGLYMPDGLKAMDAGMQGLSLADASKMDKDGLLKDGKDGGGGSSGGAPKKSWASIASQPAKPQPSTQSTGLKKKGPGMPPPPIIPGKHNMDIGTWDSGSGSSSSSSKPITVAPASNAVSSNNNNNGQVPAGPPMPQQTNMVHQQPPSPMSQPPPPMVQPPMPQQQQQQKSQQQQMPVQQQMHMQQQMVLPPQQGPLQGRPSWAPPQRAPMPRPPPPQPLLMQGPTQVPPQMPPPQLQQPLPQQALANPVLDELRVKNNYNPVDFNLSAPNARFFVIKSYSEDDIHRSIKYEIWCSTEHGNKRLDSAFREREKEAGTVYLFFSVNSSGHFCGMAQMVSPVDYNCNSSVWSQDKWKGQFKVRWIYVKDVPNGQLRHIRLENNENKAVTNSRDTQEVPHAKGLQVLRTMHTYKHTTSIFDDFTHYEKRQEEEDMRKVPEGPMYKDNHHHQGNYDGKPHHHGGCDKQDSYGGNKGNYNRDYNRDHGGYNKDHGSYNKDHGGYNKDHGGYNKDHGGYNKGQGGYNKDHGGYNKDHGGYNKDHGGYNKDHGGYNKDHYDKEHGGYHNKDHGNGGDGYGGGYNKGHRGDRDQHGGYNRDHRDQQGGGYRPHQMHKDRGDGSRGGGKGRNNRPN